MCQAQWQTTDYTYYVNQASDPEVLKTFVEDTASWAEHRTKTWLVESDATALWLRLSGQEGVVIPDTVLQKNTRSRRLARWAAQAKTDAEKQVIQACIDQDTEEGEAPEQIHFQGQSGGDKYRLTLIASIARSGWFEPGQKPKGHLLPFVLLVPCAQHTRLEDLDDQGRFNKEVQYRGPDDSPVVFHEKQSAKGKL